MSYAKAGASFIGLGCPEDFGDSKAEIEAAAQAAGRPFPKVFCYQLDVTDSKSVARVAAEVKAISPKLDILINNAGFMTPALPVVEADEELWWKTFEIKLKGTFLMYKHFTPLLLDTDGGLKTVVNINSAAAHNLRLHASAYGTSKWAVLKFTEFLLVEQAKEGILAFSAHPGGIMTQLAETMPKETHAGEQGLDLCLSYFMLIRIRFHRYTTVDRRYDRLSHTDAARVACWTVSQLHMGLAGTARKRG